MREVRVFSPDPLAAGIELPLALGPSEHLLRVLRLREGGRFVAFDGRGGEFAAELVSARGKRALVRLGAHHEVEREAPVRVTLQSALLRSDKMDWVVQKATELGVHAIVPVEAERSVVQLDERRALRRAERWREIAIGACEQCGRNKVPDISEPVPLREALAAPMGRRFVLDPEAKRSLTAACSSTSPGNGNTTTDVGGAGEASIDADMTLLIGPEGGLTDEELRLAARTGYVAVSLGARILRAETAAIGALAMIQGAHDALLGASGSTD